MIFFDIDGTLLDHDRAAKLAALDFYTVNADHLPFNDGEFIRLWNLLSLKYFEKFLAKELSFIEQRRSRIRDLFGHHLSDEQADSKFNEYLRFYRNNWVAFEDVSPCLKSLTQSGHRLGIISNGDYTQQNEKLHELGIREFFNIIVTSSEVGAAKPDVHIFLAACKKANVPAEACYYVGDQLETDAKGSKKAGMNGIWLNRKDKATDPEVRVIHSLKELGEIVQNPL